MAPRSVWSGTISFGLVNCPVKLYSAVDPHADVKFCQVHAACNTKASQKRWCAACERELAYEELGRGWPADAPVVQVTDDEIEALRPRAARVIDISHFVAEIDADYYERPYRLGPETGAEKAFTLLRQAMLDTDTAALGRFVMRSKAYPVLIRADDAGLTLHQLRWASELRPPLDAPVVELGEGERKLARLLIESLTDDSPLGAWSDEYQASVAALCEAKAAGVELPRGAEPEAAPEAVDLLAALEASLAAATSAKEAPPEEPRAEEAGG